MPRRNRPHQPKRRPRHIASTPASMSTDDLAAALVEAGICTSSVLGRDHRPDDTPPHQSDHTEIRNAP